MRGAKVSWVGLGHGDVAPQLPLWDQTCRVILAGYPPGKGAPRFVHPVSPTPLMPVPEWRSARTRSEGSYGSDLATSLLLPASRRATCRAGARFTWGEA